MTSYQDRSAAWMGVAFSADPTDAAERRDRTAEEDCEGYQAAGGTLEDWIAIGRYTFGRPAGALPKEIGQKVFTLACWAAFHGIDMMAEAERELARCSTPEFIEKLARKRATRHGRGPLPGFSGPETSDPGVAPALSPTPDGVIKEMGEGCTWDEGITYGLRQICAVLGVDPSKVRWDAATETVEGDVRSVIGNILRAWAADDWQDLPAIREMLLQGQGDDDGSQILPDFQEDMPVHAMVAECLHLLERRRDALDGYAATNGEAPTSPPDTLSSQESGVGETFDTIRQWCEETFGPASPERIASRAAEEMDELLADPSKVEEAADIVIILSRHPTLWAEVVRKMAVNRKRQWRLMGDGSGYHIKDAAPPSFPEGGVGRCLTIQEWMERGGLIGSATMSR
ncbi:hypothetical protein [Methylobacterium aquaticum]|uniref:Uncharacterized protein n=1 Tax=Methylobacterium aquaticum TaxID=270351 RepID=A0A1Y0ZBP2_9HYPH|nr:hypothetical protein [Methylobacterium aquaticum]BAR47070.1 hypothetical protein Maq22A_c27820 [Methylobacterium aquaticum]